MRIWLTTGAAGAFLSVAMGAFAAHGLEGRLGPEALDWIETGARYGLAHGVALLALAESVINRVTAETWDTSKTRMENVESVHWTGGGDAPANGPERRTHGRRAN